ncbi:hypothetical protein [Laceyella putida]|uniref:Uncharacterized protein n=1 Tax=Laceyella putida TaxID=110101 RepID=A0ABW2RFR9_9BACL
MEKKRAQASAPTLAPGLDDEKKLEQDASKEEIAKGDYTEVVTLSYDEVNPS